MARTAEDITKALKLKATPKAKALTLKVGTKKVALPFEVRTLASTDYVFVHIPPAASILKVSGGSIEVVTDAAEAASAQASFRQSRKSTGTRKKAAAPVELPGELKSALSKIPSGHRLAFDAQGNPRLVKTRKRRK